MKNETKIGLLAVISIAILIWGYKFLKGQNILTTSNLIYVKYEDAALLAPSSPVYINGFQVGVVTTLYLDEDMKHIICIMDVGKEIKVPKTATAEIFSASLMGGKAVRLVFDKPCSGGDCAVSGDYINGRVAGVISSMIPDDEMDGAISTFSKGAGDAFDSIKKKIDEEEALKQSFDNINKSLANLESTTTKLDRLMASSGSKVEAMLNSLQSVSSNIEASNSDIKMMLSNASSFSGKLNNLDLQKTLGETNNTMANANEAVTKLQTTLSTANGALDNVNQLIDKIKNSEGTIGKLLTDDALSTNLDATLIQFKTLAEDIRLHPERYRRVLSKKKMPYEAPTSGN